MRTLRIVATLGFFGSAVLACTMLFDVGYWASALCTAVAHGSAVWLLWSQLR